MQHGCSRRCLFRKSQAGYLTECSGSSLKRQLVDGEPQATTPTNRTHGSLQGELTRLLGNHLLAQSSPCTVVVEPGVALRLQVGRVMRVPDLAVSCMAYDVEQSSLADPLLIVEILSPSNQRDTWASIWAYTSVPSVCDILVLYSAMVCADVLRRRPNGIWPSTPDRITGGDLVLGCIGFVTPLMDLYRTTRLRRAA